MSNEDLTAEAAALAERILEEVSNVKQDWGNIAAWARELATVAEAAIEPPAAPPPNPRERDDR